MLPNWRCAAAGPAVPGGAVSQAPVQLRARRTYAPVADMAMMPSRVRCALLLTPDRW